MLMCRPKWTFHVGTLKCPAFIALCSKSAPTLFVLLHTCMCDAFCSHPLFALRLQVQTERTYATVASTRVQGWGDEVPTWDVVRECLLPRIFVLFCDVEMACFVVFYEVLNLKYVMVLREMFPLTPPPNQNIGGDVSPARASPAVLTPVVRNHTADNGTHAGEGRVPTTIISESSLPQRPSSRCFQLHPGA